MAPGQGAEDGMRLRITTRFVMLVATAGVLPLVLYGGVSIYSLRKGNQESVIAGNLNVARQAAEQVKLYVSANVKVLQALAADLRQTHLEPWQQDRILKNHVLDFPEFRELTLFDALGRPAATSRLGAPRVRIPAGVEATGAQSYLAPVTVDDDFLPTTTVALPLSGLDRHEGWLVGELAVEELWRMVDAIRVGQEGFALVVGDGGQLIAHGNPDEKARVASNDNLKDHPLIAAIQARQTARPPALATGDPPPIQEVEYLNASGRQLLAVGAPIESLGWSVIVEQPTDEAFALANQLELQLVAIIVLALLVTVTLGYYWGRSFIRPIFALMRGTQAIALGRLDERVEIAGGDEFHQLGDAFNQMADRLVELQENVRRQERQAMFGRIAAGLVHDISHPIQNIGNSCKLILKLFDDHEYRATFKRTIEREFATIKRVLEDLRHLARPMPLERFPVDVNRSVGDVVEAMQSLAETAGVSLGLRLAPEPLYIEGDLFALGRVYRNLILNAIEATAPGGSISIATVEQGEQVLITVADTGLGIPRERLHLIFDDFNTTKRRGLGLGLAISKKIVEQLNGTISVDSRVGEGTTFLLRFPKTSGRPLAAVAAAS